MNEDAKIIIGTSIDDSGFRKGLNNIEKQANKSNIEVNADIDIDKTIESAKASADKFGQELEKSIKEYGVKSTKELYDAFDNMDLSNVTLAQDEMKSNVEQLIVLLDKMLDEYQEISSKKFSFESDKQDAEELRQKIMQIVDALQQLTGEKITIKGINDVNKNINFDLDKIGQKLKDITNKVVKWGLALFGVRSMYNFIRQSMSTLSQYDETMAKNIEYIRYALASSLKPIIEWVLNAVKTLLTYINYIWSAWFKKPLFPSVKEFTNNTNKANASAKKLQKTLAGFDEINVLNNSSENNLGGIASPDFDLGKTDNIKVPKWIEWIANHKDLILTVLGALATTFAAATIAKWVKNLSGLATALGYGSTGILGLLQAIIGIGAIVITITIAKKIWDEAAELKKDIQNIRKAGAEYQKEYIANEKNIQNLLNTSNANRQAGNELLKKTGALWNMLNGLGRENLETAKQTAITIGWQIDKEIELWKESGKNKEEQEQIKENIYEQYKYNLEVIKKLKENGYETGQIELLNEHLIENYKEMGGEVNIVKDELGDIKKIKFDNKNLVIDVTADTSRFTEALKKAYEYANKLVGGLGFSYGGGGKGSSGSGGGGGYRAKGGIYYPKLAVGGIISQPGRGVPYHGAIIGERGAEAVLPLTDSQQMELLGEAIGRYITVNLTNVTELDGRTIARKVQEVNNNNNFLMNR